MNICNIVPPDLLESFVPLADRMHLVLADVILSNQRYREYYQQRTLDSFVILDPPVFENGEYDVDDYFEAARLLRPQELVLVDKRYSDSDTSYDLACDCLDKISLFQEEDDGGYWQHVSLAGVPWGSDVQDWMRSVKLLASLPGVRTLMIPEETDEVYGVHRSEMVTLCKRIAPQHKIHLLGMLEDMSDLKNPETRKQIRSCDSAKLFVWGLDGILVDPKRSSVPRYPGRPEGFFEMTLQDVSNVAAGIIRQNMNLWRQYISTEIDDVLWEPRTSPT
jgi:hypothetical protein